MQNLEKQLQLALKKCEQLKLENRELKELLKYHNINPDTILSLQNTKMKVTNTKQKIQERIKIFKNLFKGRMDVYAARWESRNGQSGYSPACENEWHPTLCKKPVIKCADCQYRKLLPLTDQVIYDHLSGKQTVGLYPLLQDETCWFLAVDFDKKNWQKDVQAFIDTCKELNVPASIERSRSGNGCHVWIFFEQELPASLARKLGNVLLSNTLAKRYEVGMDSYDRLFPNQDTLPKGGFGNLIALPLQHDSRKNDNSVFIDENFIPHHDQWLYLRNVHKIKVEEIKYIIKTVHQSDTLSTDVKENRHHLNNNNQMKIPSTLTIIEKNGLYIEKEGLPSSFIHKLIQLATFKNPEFFKAQAKRLSTYEISRNITCSVETDCFLILPRGCKDKLIQLLNVYSIEYNCEDRTNLGTKISIDFKGKLRTEQEYAVKKLFEHPIGILSATTGFGKTVVAAALIAERKINTLIIVHRKQLIDQWKKSLSMFLNIEENQIGQIGGGKNKQSAVIDIATIQSFNYKGKIKELVTQYGQIIVDECHHISAYSFEQVLKKADAKYIYGLTATPTRKDGLQPIMTMQLGSIRYKVNAKKQAMIQPFEHVLLPRYTNFKSVSKGDSQDIQSLYKELINDKNRNQMIFDDEERLIIATRKYIGEGLDHARLDTLFLVMPLSWKGTLQQYVGRIHRLHNQKLKVKVFDYVDHKEPMLKAMFEKRMKSYISMGYNIQQTKSLLKPTSEQMKLF